MFSQGKCGDIYLGLESRRFHRTIQIILKDLNLGIL